MTAEEADAARRRGATSSVADAHAELKESMAGPPDDRPARARPHDEPRAARPPLPEDTAALAQRAAAAGARRLQRAPQAQAASSSSAARPPGEDGRDRLGARRGAGLRLAAGAGRADPPDRPGHRARHVQPAPPGAPRRRDAASAGARCRTCTTRSVAVRAAQQPAVRAGLPRLRVRLLRAGARRARAVGGPVRRLRELAPR